MNLCLYSFLSLILITCLLLTAGCTTAPPKTSEPVKSPGTTQQAPRSPTDAELKAIIANFDAYAEKARQDWGLPGMAIAIVKDEKVIFAKGYGTKAAGGLNGFAGFATFDLDASGRPVRVTSDLFIESTYGTKATFAQGG
jgi:hypothetical protein